MHLTLPVARLAQAREALAVVGFTALMAASARFEIPFIPVPFTLQTLVVVLSGWFLGRRALASQGLYLGLGVAGLPVFAQGKVGLATLVGPTGGYLVGFLVAAGLIGWFSDRGADRNLFTRVAFTAAAQALILSLGFAYLATQVGTTTAWTVGVLPFLAGEAVKLFVAQCVLAMRTPKSDSPRS